MIWWTPRPPQPSPQWSTKTELARAAVRAEMDAERAATALLGQSIPEKIFTAMEAARIQGLPCEGLRLTRRDLHKLPLLAMCTQDGLLFGLRLREISDSEPSAVLARRKHGKYEAVPMVEFPL